MIYDVYDDLNEGYVCDLCLHLMHIDDEFRKFGS